MVKTLREKVDFADGRIARMVAQKLSEEGYEVDLVPEMISQSDLVFHREPGYEMSIFEVQK